MTRSASTLLPTGLVLSSESEQEGVDPNGTDLSVLGENDDI